MLSRRAERHSDADFLDALGHAVCQQAVESNAGQDSASTPKPPASVASILSCTIVLATCADIGRTSRTVSGSFACSVWRMLAASAEAELRTRATSDVVAKPLSNCWNAR